MCSSIIVDLVDSESYYFERHASEYEKIEGEHTIYVLKQVKQHIPTQFTIDAYGWGPFKQLVIRR